MFRLIVVVYWLVIYKANKLSAEGQIPKDKKRVVAKIDNHPFIARKYITREIFRLAMLGKPQHTQRM